jgi:ribosomal-protein-alanine N-acetyltransferase
LQNYVIEKNNSKNEFLFGIFYKKYYIGNIKIGPINKKLNSAPIGYIIGDKLFWNRGVATIAIKKIVNFGFTKLKLKRITSNSEVKNLFSSRALIINNFKKIKKEINKNRKLFLYSIKNPNK